MLIKSFFENKEKVMNDRLRFSGGDRSREFNLHGANNKGVQTSRNIILYPDLKSKTVLDSRKQEKFIQ